MLREGAQSGAFEGIGTVNTGDQGRVRQQRFRVTVTEGGAGEGTLQLTLLGPEVVIALPVEWVLTGQITSTSRNRLADWCS